MGSIIQIKANEMPWSMQQYYFTPHKNQQTVVLFPRKKTNTWDNTKVDSPIYVKQIWLSKF